MDKGASDPSQPERWRARVLLHLVPGWRPDRDAGRCGRAALGDRGCLRDCQDGVRSGSQRDPLLAWLAPARLARDAGLRDDGCGTASRKPPTAPKKNQPGASERELIRWSVQEIRRIAMRLAQRRICPTYIIAWSVWRSAHQAAAQEAPIKRKL